MPLSIATWPWNEKWACARSEDYQDMCCEILWYRAFWVPTLILMKWEFKTLLEYKDFCSFILTDGLKKIKSSMILKLISVNLWEERKENWLFYKE